MTVNIPLIDINHRLSALLAALVMVLTALPAPAYTTTIVLQSTTSTANSGLYDYILPLFTKETGIHVNVVAVGTGQAIKNAMNGDGDVLLVHAKSAEQQFVADGYGVQRFDVMYNDFVVLGLAADPAKVSDSKTISEALQRIAATNSKFASRGDDSGTHKKERALWKAAGIDPIPHSGTWYLETGSSMGATLNLAVESGAYTLSDRSTWISFKNKKDYRIVFEGDDGLFNQYGVILVNPKKHPHVQQAAGQAFINWLTGAQGQRAIAAYRVAAQQLFFPNAK